MPEQDTKVNVLDLIVKYATLMGALAYALGFAEEYTYAEKLGAAGDLSVADPKYFGHSICSRNIRVGLPTDKAKRWLDP